MNSRQDHVTTDRGGGQEDQSLASVSFRHLSLKHVTSVTAFP
jgi:hypothetical protein